MPTPGLLWVNSKITRPDILSEEVFTKWYTEDHIPEVLASGGIHSAFRYISPDKSVDRPYLALYPLEDIDFLQTAAFKSISVESPLLPGSGKIFDVADFDVRYLEKVQTYEPAGTKPGRGTCIMSVGMEPSVSDEDFDDWYRKQHLDMLSMCDGYLRTTRYKLHYARANRPTADSVPVSGKPRFYALHEFDSMKLPVEQLNKTGETEWSKKVMSTAKTVEAPVFEFYMAFGKDKSSKL